MRLSDIRENASAGSTTAANMGTTIYGGTPPKGQFFGGDPASSIYPTIKKHRKARKLKVSEDTSKTTFEIAPDATNRPTRAKGKDGRWWNLVDWGVVYSHDNADSKVLGYLPQESYVPEDENPTEYLSKEYGPWDFGGNAVTTVEYQYRNSKIDKVNEETKTAKPPQKPSGKSEIIGSTKPYREPKVLGPTAKVKSVGKILGGKPKKNPTLSTKFFGTCSANNDPGNKSIIAELTYREFKNATKAIAKVCPNCGNSFKNVHDIKQQFCSKDCENEGQVSLKLKEAWERPIQTEFVAKDGGKVVGLEDISRLVKRVMDDSHGQMGRLQACLFVAGMFKNCTGWTIHFALEDYAKMKANEMYGEK